MDKEKKAKIRSHIISYTLVALAAAVSAVGVWVFILPNRFSPGGLTGIAAAIYYIVPAVNPGYMILAMNVPLLIAAFFMFKRQYVVKTIVAISVSSGLLMLFGALETHVQFIGETMRYHTDNIILPAIAGGVVRGVAMGVMIKMGGSNGGSEIVGGLVNKKWPHLNVTRIILAVDVAVILGTAFAATAGRDDIVFLDIIILSIINMVVSALVANNILQGFNSALKFEIITMHEAQLSRDLVMELGRGVTKIKARGGYTGQEKTILICIIKNRQVAAFNRILKNYPDTFAYMVSTKEVYGRGFSIPNVQPEKFGTAAGEGAVDIENHSVPPAAPQEID